MPISADPNDCVEFTLEADRDKPVKPFKLRFLTVKQRLAVDRLIREAGELADDEAANAKLSEVVSLGVANLGDFGDLDDVLSVYEKWELAYAIQTRTALEELDRKKSRSQVTAAAPATGESAT